MKAILTLSKCAGLIMVVSGLSVASGANASKMAKRMYVTNPADNLVSTYVADMTTGALIMANQKSTMPTGTYPVAIKVTPDKKFAYVANGSSNDITMFTIDQSESEGSNGLLTSNGSIATGGTNPIALAISPRSDYLYVANKDSKNISVFKINSSNGKLTLVMVQGPGYAPTGLAVNPNGKFLYVTNGVNNTSGTNGVYTYTINSDGTLGASTATKTGFNPTKIIVTQNAKYAYVVNSGSAYVSQYIVSESNGSLSSNPDAPTVSSGGSVPVAIAADEWDQFAYIANTENDRMSMYTIGSNGVLSFISEFEDDVSSAFYNPADLVVDVGTDTGVYYLYSTYKDENALVQWDINTYSGAIGGSLQETYAINQPYAMAWLNTYYEDITPSSSEPIPLTFSTTTQFVLSNLYTTVTYRVNNTNPESFTGLVFSTHPDENLSNTTITASINQEYTTCGDTLAGNSWCDVAIDVYSQDTSNWENGTFTVSVDAIYPDPYAGEYVYSTAPMSVIDTNKS